MTLTRNAIGNLVNRYKAVLNKCNLINAFGTLAVAAMLVLGGAGVAVADRGINWVKVGNSWKRLDPKRFTTLAGVVGTATKPDAVSSNVDISRFKKIGTTIYGGYSASGDAYNNRVSTSIWLKEGELYGGYSVGGHAYNNSVTIGRALKENDVFGGYSVGGHATGNSVTIYANMISGSSIYGGYSEQGNANNNSVTINRAHSFSNFYGGYSEQGNANYNSVTLGNGTQVKFGGVYGGSGLLGAGPRYYTGNTLTVKGAATVGSLVANFQYYNFDIHGSIKSGGTLLNALGNSIAAANTPGIDFGDAAEVRNVNVYGARKVGDVFSLVQSGFGMVNADKLSPAGGTPIEVGEANMQKNTSATEDGIFEYGLYFDAAKKNLYAKITDVLDLKGDDFVNVLDGTLSGMFWHAYEDGEVVPSFADDPFMPEGVRFLARAINEHYGNCSSDAEKAVESVTQVAALAAVPQMALGANLAGVGAIGQRTTIGQPTGSLQSTTPNAASGLNSGDDIAGLSAGGGYDKSGFAMWIMPLWQSNNSFGVTSGEFEMDSHASIGGIAIGADYTIEQAVRLGLTFNIGGGYAEGSGDMAKTRNNMRFWGAGAYAGWKCDDFGLTADINYTSTHNDIRQEVDPSFGMPDMESEVMASTISAGLRAEYKFDTDALDIIPHVGVRYIHLTTYGYDVDSAGQTVLEADTTRQNIWTFPVGVQFAKSFDLENGWYVRPSLDLNVTPAAGDIEVKREVRFTGVTASASPETQTMDWITYGGQAGLEFGNDNVKLGLNYTLQAGAHTTNHGVFGSLRYEF